MEVDRWHSQVYFIEDLDLFHVIDYDSTPTLATKWVVVRRLSTQSVVIERWRGQPFIGVVKILEFYQLIQSEQWAPRQARI